MNEQQNVNLIYNINFDILSVMTQVKKKLYV